VIAGGRFLRAPIRRAPVTAGRERGGRQGGRGHRGGGHRRSAGCRPVGRLRRRRPYQAVVGEHRRQRLVLLEDGDQPRRPGAGGPGAAGRRRPRRGVLARVRGKRQGRRPGPPRHGAHVRCLRLGEPDDGAGPVRRRRVDREPRRTGPVVGARNGLGLPREQPGSPDRRAGPAGQRLVPDRVRADRAVGAARCGLPDRPPARGRRAGRGDRAPAPARHRLRRAGPRQRHAADVREPGVPGRGGQLRPVATSRDRRGERARQRTRPVPRALHDRARRNSGRASAPAPEHDRPRLRGAGTRRGPRARPSAALGDGFRTPGAGRPALHPRGAGLLLGRLRRLPDRHRRGPADDHQLRHEQDGRRHHRLRAVRRVRHRRLRRGRV
ncbi:MAG: Putative esterase, partial [uncultured Blastococcus sp.]